MADAIMPDATGRWRALAVDFAVRSAGLVLAAVALDFAHGTFEGQGTATDWTAAYLFPVLGFGLAILGSALLLFGRAMLPRFDL